MPELEEAILIRWEPKWQPPLILSTCPSCGRRVERTSGAWHGTANGGVQARMPCWPLSVKAPECWRTWDDQVPYPATPTENP